MGLAVLDIILALLSEIDRITEIFFLSQIFNDGSSAKNWLLHPLSNK
jgi:hypothetical protein